ncbi:MAG: ABC transporter permease, partial [Bryobacteraceae bacterium]
MRRRAGGILRREKWHRELDEEMRLHRELRASEIGNGGVGAEEAERAAQRRFGNDLVLREESRDMWGWGWLEDVLQDLRYALRMLRTSPGFTLAAILTLALAVGANAAIFSVVESAFTRSLAFPDAGRIVHLWETRASRQIAQMEASYPNYTDWEARNHVFEDLSGYSGRVFMLTSSGETSRMFSGAVTWKFFRALGVKPILGRDFTAADSQQGAPNIALITYGLW